MITICPECSKRHEISKPSETADFCCLCGKTHTVLPDIFLRKIVSEPKIMGCSECGRTHDLRQYRYGTEIYCGCGNAIIEVIPAGTDTHHYGRRKIDQNLYLRDVELRGLMETSRIIHSSTTDLSKLLLAVVKVTNAIMAVEGTSVVLIDNKTNELVFHSVTGNKADKLSDFRIKRGEGIVGQCVLHVRPVIVNDVRSDNNYCSRADEASGFITRSTLCVPLVVEDKCLGAMQMVNKKDPDGFNEYDKLLSTSIASQVAVAMRNFQLIEEALTAERLASIGQAVTGIAHCVKNMLTGLQGGLYILKTEIKKTTPDANLDGYNMLKQNIGRLTDIVGDMLTYSKDRQPEYSTANINELVASVVQLMAVKSGELGLKIVFNPGDGMQEIVIDEKGIYRCVLNLVSNALDACAGKEGAEVSVITAQQELEALISVKDQGCGMDANTLKSIFRPFFSTKGSRGTGLGLSVTQKIISECGGRVEVLSEVGQGSTFNIYLPSRAA